MTDNQLFIFGDSISCGVMYDEAAHRYTLCRNTYDRVLRTQGVAVKSYAKPGCTAADAVRMLDKAEPLPGAEVPGPPMGQDAAPPVVPPAVQPSGVVPSA